MKTIVEYDAKRRPCNRYPKKIISPPFPSHCCLTRMRRIGEVQVEEGGLPFFYKRCPRCGYTVREFFSKGVDGFAALEGFGSNDVEEVLKGLGQRGLLIELAA